MTDYPDTSHWHVLLDRICLERGHHDNLHLAEALCRTKRLSSQAAFEAALKNLANWRQGLHTPSRRNFYALSQLLEIDTEDAARRSEWQALYDSANRRRPADSMEGSDNAVTPHEYAASPHSSKQGFLARTPWLTRIATLSLLIVVALSIPFLKGREPAEAAANSGPQVVDMTGQEVFWERSVTLKVGQSASIHGRRGPSCGAPPPDWEAVLKYLPPLSTAIWSDGGVGFRVSRACNGPTPVRAVVVTAIAPGTDQIILYDDPITITVSE